MLGFARQVVPLGTCALFLISCDSSRHELPPRKAEPVFEAGKAGFSSKDAVETASQPLPVSFGQLRLGASVSITWEGYGSKSIRLLAHRLAEILTYNGFKIVQEEGEAAEFTLFLSRVNPERERHQAAGGKQEAPTSLPSCSADAVLYDNTQKVVLAHYRNVRPVMHKARLLLGEAAPRLSWSEVGSGRADGEIEGTRTRLSGLFQRLTRGAAAGAVAFRPGERVFVFYRDEVVCAVRPFTNYGSKDGSPFVRLHHGSIEERSRRSGRFA